MLKNLMVAFVITTLAPPAMAQNWQLCEDLWFIRNTIFDRAGQCFASPLGQAMFDNADCVAKPVPLGATAARKVANIRFLESEWNCRVDTSQTHLDIPLLPLRRALTDLPVTAGYASGCLDWQGATFELLTGHSDTASVLGRVYPGDDIVWEYDTESAPGGWAFITIYRDSKQVSLGWSNLDIDHDMCGGLAG